MSISYAVEDAISLEEFMLVLTRSGLGERRPMHDRRCLQGMLDHANVLVTARADGVLIGIARSVTDFHYCCYLSDLAVDRDYQGQGIGQALLQQTQRQLTAACTLILISAPAAESYYRHLGYDHCERCYLTTTPAVDNTMSDQK